jgi:hypothetical protein
VHCRLSATAPQLQRLALPEDVSHLSKLVSLFKLASNEHDAGSFPPYVVDSIAAVGQVDSWLQVVQDNYSTAQELPSYTESSPPLFIHGFIKVQSST